MLMLDFITLICSETSDGQTTGGHRSRGQIFYGQMAVVKCHGPLKLEQLTLTSKFA